MSPGTVVHLTKSITTKSGGCIATYKLFKNAPAYIAALQQLHTFEPLKEDTA